jgi:DNA-binding MarR family transcriptional regulator
MTTDSCAHLILDVVPEVNQFIRSEMRANRAKGLSVPQFRAMVFLSKNSGSSLSMLADYLALSPAGTSAIVEGLVERGFAGREEASGDRRMIALTLTSDGRRNLDKARDAALKRLASALEGLDQEQSRAVSEAMNILREVFSLRSDSTRR